MLEAITDGVSIDQVLVVVVVLVAALGDRAVVLLYAARYVVSVRADTWLGAAAMPAS